MHAEGEDELTEFQCFPKLLSDNGDESDRPLSDQAIADLVYTNLVAKHEAHMAPSEGALPTAPSEGASKEFDDAGESRGTPVTRHPAQGVKGTEETFLDRGLVNVPDHFVKILDATEAEMILGAAEAEIMRRKEVRTSSALHAAGLHDEADFLKVDGRTQRTETFKELRTSSALYATGLPDETEGFKKDAYAVHFCVGDDALHVAGDDEDEFLEIEVALDSGATDHVADEIDAPGYEVAESPGSRSGQSFSAAGGHRLKNRGQMSLELFTMNNDKVEGIINSVFQVAAVTRPLWSVSKIADAGCTAKFDAQKAEILDKNQKVICTFERRGGLYVAKMRMKNPKHSGFIRPGQ